MNTLQKVTYQTKQGLKFNTIIKAQNIDEATGIMVREYAFDQITILKIRPSVKQKYIHVCNYQIK
jgi:hypothetical protein